MTRDGTVSELVSAELERPLCSGRGSCGNVGDEPMDTVGERGDKLGVVWETATLEVAGYERNLDDKPILVQGVP